MRKGYDKWNKEALKQLPELSVRTFALRDVHYCGKGFHYALEAQLGKVINYLNNPEEYPVDLSCELIHEVVFEGFIKTLQEAEVSAKNSKFNRN